MKYNPFARNFYRIRRVLIETCDLPRHAVRPSAKMAELIPRDQRQRVIDRLRREQLNLRTITVIPIAWIGFVTAAMVVWVLASVTLGMSYWFVVPGAILAALATGKGLAYISAMEFEPSLTVGDLVLAITSPSQCREAGYRMSRNEIFLKVRRVVAASAGVDPSQIKPETSFTEDLGLG
jgi:hypothetical protein